MLVQRSVLSLHLTNILKIEIIDKIPLQFHLPSQVSFFNFHQMFIVLRGNNSDLVFLAAFRKNGRAFRKTLRLHQVPVWAFPKQNPPADDLHPDFLEPLVAQSRVQLKGLPEMSLTELGLAVVHPGREEEFDLPLVDHTAQALQILVFRGHF